MVLCVEEHVCSRPWVGEQSFVSVNCLHSTSIDNIWIPLCEVTVYHGLRISLFGRLFLLKKGT
jgi:hypothetical protein